MAPFTRSPKSFQWMLAVGVDAVDVEWLERMSGSTELHLPHASSRVERIYHAAMEGMLSSPSPAAQLLRALN